MLSSLSSSIIESSLSKRPLIIIIKDITTALARVQTTTVVVFFVREEYCFSIHSINFSIFFQKIERQDF